MVGQYLAHHIFMSGDTMVCVSCGKQLNNDTSGTVCQECIDEFAKLKQDIENSDDAKFMKICEYCGRPFISKHPIIRGGKQFYQKSKRKYCDGFDGNCTHFSTCECCGAAIASKISKGNILFRGYCSTECLNKTKREKTVKTNIERYGAAVPSQNEEVKQKIRNTNMERYGVPSYLCAGHTRDLANASLREKYGVESNISQSAEIQEKIRERAQREYGVDHPNQRPEVIQAHKDGMVAKFGYESPQQVPEIKQRTKETVKQIYGVENVMQSEEVKAKMIQRSREVSGVDWPSQRPELIRQRTEKLRMNFAESIQDETIRTNYLKFRADPKAYLESLQKKPTLTSLYKSLGYSDGTAVCSILIDNGLQDLVDFRYSSMESEVCDFLKSLIPDVNIQMRNRRIIAPLELDIYLPNYKIAIECNPTYTHNSTVPPFGDRTKVLPPYYHKEKSDLCKKRGIFLFHIFGYEWTYKQDVIKSMLSNLLGVTARKIYARDTYVSVVSYNEAVAFLNKNHRQGYMTSKIRLGLRVNDTDELVSLMTFNKPRKGIGKTSDDGLEWELGRFCNVLNTNVVGGASKLFKHFIKNYEYSKIVSFSDIAHTKGNLYGVLGFTAVSESSPGYVWVHMFNDLYLTRTACRKNNLRKLFNDPTIDIENKTEAMIMAEHGFVQVFDCGVIRWEFCKP